MSWQMSQPRGRCRRPQRALVDPDPRRSDPDPRRSDPDPGRSEPTPAGAIPTRAGATPGLGGGFQGPGSLVGSIWTSQSAAVRACWCCPSGAGPRSMSRCCPGKLTDNDRVATTELSGGRAGWMASLASAGSGPRLANLVGSLSGSLPARARRVNGAPLPHEPRCPARSRAEPTSARSSKNTLPKHRVSMARSSSCRLSRPDRLDSRTARRGSSRGNGEGILIQRPPRLNGSAATIGAVERSPARSAHDPRRATVSG